MTERLYYHDCYLREFSARVVETADQGRRVYLDRSVFYPASGGQPFDVGTLAGVVVREVVDEEDRIAHVMNEPLVPAAGAEMEGSIDWARRYDHMQQHTGQHLLSAVLEELFGAATIGFHMGAEVSTIDVSAATLDAGQIERVEERCAEIVSQARAVTISFEEGSGSLGLRKASERSGTLRIVSIQGIDRSACGGTHVRSTAEIGLVLVRKLEKIRGTLRLEFVCGGRALRRARADYRLLAEAGRKLSAPLENLPELVGGLIDKNKALEKTAQKLATELARREGRELYLATEPSAAGVRRLIQKGAIDEAMRVRAQAFSAGEKAVFLAICDQPPSILLAASPDSGVHAGDRVKAAVAAAGGRGGGNATLAQGSAPALEPLLAALNWDHV
jgi:alanyl-tRNA synthetase